MPSSKETQVSSVGGFVIERDTKSEKKGKKQYTYTSKYITALKQDDDSSQNNYTVIHKKASVKGVEDKDGVVTLKGSMKDKKSTIEKDMSLADVLEAMKKLMKVHTKKSQSGRSRSRSRSRGKKKDKSK